MKYFLGLTASFMCLILLNGCGSVNPVDDTSADSYFTTIVALGDSLTAGVQDGTLVPDKSFATLFAQQAGRSVGTTASSDFVYPSFDSNYNLTNLFYSAPYNLLGFPSAKIADLLRSELANASNDPTSNALFQGILRNIDGSPFAGKTPVQEAKLLSPTFVLLWIGNNDVLGSALSGKTTEPTSASAFESALQTIITTLTSNSTRLAVANIPNVTSIPYVTALNPYPVIVYGEDDGQISALSPTADYVLISAKDLLTQGAGTSTQNALADQYWLSSSEIESLTTVVNAYNAAIQNLASTVGFPVVDINSLLADVAAANGLTLDGITFTTEPVTGNTFCADYIHLTNKGYAAITNQFIDAVNAYYSNANLVKLDLSEL